MEQIDNPIGEAAFIVIPGEHLDHVISDNLCAGCIHN